MSQYFFHTYDGRNIYDHEGADLADLATARTQAVKLMGELLQDQPNDIWANRALSLTVTDEDQLVLFTIDVVVTDAPVVGRPSWRSA